MGNRFQKLTPVHVDELGIYQEAIEYVFSEDDITNIAVSGAYGAGKSSVIKTYEEENPDKKFLHISLAHFEEVDGNDAELEEKRLEGKILNQLIHQIHPDKIPLTNFKIKREADTEKVWGYTWWCTGFAVLLLFIMFHKKWCGLMNTIGIDNKFAAFFVSKDAVLFAGIALLALTIKGMHTLIKMQMEKKLLKKISVQGNDFEILEDCEDSYFDKYLNEVLYLFEKADIDAIVFEDIDRFGSNNIFEKLREINTLLKNRKEPLRFFYLLRDDIFESADRTKFFDLIIPVVPVIDSSNAYDKFVEHFREAGILDLFSNEFLKGLALFVDDMRILKNIQNEFVIYYERFSGKAIGLDWNKLLAIITYKNLFPKDFSDLQLKRGYVYTIFASKEKFKEQEMLRLNKEIEELKEKLQEAEKEVCQNLDELDAVYFMNDRPLRVNNKAEHTFLSRAAFIRAMKDNPDQIEYELASPYYGWKKYNANTIFDIIHNSDDYKKRKEFVELKSEREKRKLQLKIAALEGNRQVLSQKSLKKLINRKNKSEVFGVTYENVLHEEERFEAIKRSPYFELIQYLIKEGYIDESYPDYMTYFYENSISANDKKFLRGVLGEKTLPYDYALTNPHKVIEELELRYFTQEETLNFELLDCLLENTGKYVAQLKTFLHHIYTDEPDDFVARYLQRGKHRRNFILKMGQEWRGTCNWILSEERFEEARAQYVIDMLCVSSDEFILSDVHKEKLREYLNENIATIQLSDNDVPKIMQGIILLCVKVKKIAHEAVNRILLEEIYYHNAYELSANMVEVILEYFYKFRPEDIDWESNLSQIFAQENEPLCQYVKENIADYIKVVLGQAVTIFDKEDVVQYVLNEDTIAHEDKQEYIKGLMTTVVFLKDIKDVTLWPLLLQADIVAESTKNMCDYYFNSGQELDENLIGYINNSETELTIDSASLDRAYGENSRLNLFESVLECAELADEKYEKLIVSFKYYYEEFETQGLSINKLNILINTNIVRMTENNLKFLRTEYPDAVRIFIKNNMESYVELVQSKAIFAEEELVYLLEEYPTAKSKVDEAIVKLTIQHLDYVMQEELSVNIELLETVLADEKMEKDVCKELLAVYLPNMRKEDVLICLKKAGLDKFYSVFSGKRPLFEKRQANEKLLQVMKECGLISSFGDDKQNPGYYKAYGKRKKL